MSRVIDMTEQRYYKISEEQLLELLRDRTNLGLLDYIGVDNWSWYGEGWSEWLKEWAEELNPGESYADKDIDINDVAKMQLSLYERI